MVIYAVVELIDDGMYIDKTYLKFFTTQEKAQKYCTKMTKHSRGEFHVVTVEVE